jgi:hypothetical protein
VTSIDPPLNRQIVWKARFTVSLVMLFLACLGMAFTDLKSEGAWIYWRAITPVYALLSIGLSFYLKHKKAKDVVWTIWHEIAHWVGLLASIYVLSLLVRMGFMGRFEAGVETILLLALATFLAGVYIEPTHLVIGAILGLIVLGIGFVNQYLYGIFLPIIVIALVLIFWISRTKKPANPP